MKPEVISCFSPLFLAFKYRFLADFFPLVKEYIIKEKIMKVQTITVALIYIQVCPPWGSWITVKVTVLWCSVRSVLEFKFHSSFWHTH